MFFEATFLSQREGSQPFRALVCAKCCTVSKLVGYRFEVMGYAVKVRNNNKLSLLGTFSCSLAAGDNVGTLVGQKLSRVFCIFETAEQIFNRHHCIVSARFLDCVIYQIPNQPHFDIFRMAASKGCLAIRPTNPE